MNPIKLSAGAAGKSVFAASDRSDSRRSTSSGDKKSYRRAAAHAMVTMVSFAAALLFASGINEMSDVLLPGDATFRALLEIGLALSIVALVVYLEIRGFSVSHEHHTLYQRN